ncbi:hypothetical protein [Kineothrix sedimenti]|uniref:Uncharacterized protein n=1 Tax=Kineothrix sedimenti TaxID=3123317 RepID=A0ABZ3ETB9_9FIRM
MKSIKNLAGLSGRKKRLNVSVTDTGNAMSDDEIMELSRNINVDEFATEEKLPRVQGKS